MLHLVKLWSSTFFVKLVSFLAQFLWNFLLSILESLFDLVRWFDHWLEDFWASVVGETQSSSKSQLLSEEEEHAETRSLANSVSLIEVKIAHQPWSEVVGTIWDITNQSNGFHWLFLELWEGISKLLMQLRVEFWELLLIVASVFGCRDCQVHEWSEESAFSFALELFGKVVVF